MSIGRIITGKPLGYRIVIEGEVAAPGITEQHVHGMIQTGLSFSAQLASCNRSMQVQVGDTTKPDGSPA